MEKDQVRDSRSDQKPYGLKHKPYRNIVLEPNPGFVSRRALRKCVCANRQSYQNVSREAFWYDSHANTVVHERRRDQVADPAFTISELRRGFETGFLIARRFLLIELIVFTLTISIEIYCLQAPALIVRQQYF